MALNSLKATSLCAQHGPNLTGVSCCYAGTALGFFISRYWLILPGMVSLFFLQHALQGWCPPLPIIRRMGMRTAAEIFTEREIIQNQLKGNLNVHNLGENRQ